MDDIKTPETDFEGWKKAAYQSRYPLDKLKQAIDEIERLRAMRPVLQDWVMELPLRMQSVLLLGLRGPDTHQAPGIKTIVRWLRALTFVPGNPDNVLQFMAVALPDRILEKSDTARELEFTTQHYYSHLMHALEVVGYEYKPEEPTITLRAHDLFSDMCALFHLPIESRKDFERRLRQMEWPEGKQPRDGKEAFELIKKHDAFSEPDRKLWERL